ncbi:MAG: amidohydrolase [Calditrichaeota bacterium]|nr:amidohydrolase [Calditrichota bacterium]
MWPKACVFVGFAVVLLTGCSQPPDLAVVARKIVTMDEERPQAEVLLVRGDRIVAVGSREQLAGDLKRARKVLDFGDAVVYPGFIDAHLHVAGTGRALMELNLVGTSSLDEVLTRVREKAVELEPGEWLLGRGWDQNDWPVKRFPTKFDLDRVVPDRPVYLKRIDGHAGWANSAALRLAGIDASTPDPEGGRIVRLPGSREPSGVLVDNAMGLMSAVLPQADRELVRKQILKAMDHFASLGLTCVHDAGVDSVDLTVYRELVDAGQAKVRVVAMLLQGPILDDYFRSGPVLDYGNGMLTIRCVKLFADGALGSRGAALFEPYSDDPGNRGLLVTPPEEIEKVTERALRAGFQVATHAIGDRANHLVLDAYEKALAAVPTADHRLRVEHAQVLAPEDIPRFAKLGVIPSMQPTHATSDMPWAEDRLGPDRIRGAYAWRSLLDTGVRIPGGSDSPVESANPLLGIYAAVTRQDLSGNPPGGWYPEQRVTLHEALRMFTVDAAYAAFQEHELGSLSPGKKADLTVLDRDLASVPPSEIPRARVVATVVGGNVVYSRE